MTQAEQSEGDRILLAHGGGGEMTRLLIQNEILGHLRSAELAKLLDSAVLSLGDQRIALTTDAYVVRPLFFRGGDIGRLSICGTVNDLAVVGARPIAIAASLILEEGFPLAQLRKILTSMQATAEEACVEIVTGDTKVVERGSCDGLFVNTAGVGVVPNGRILGYDLIRPGDRVIINGPVASHGIAVLSEREGLSFSTPVVSDVAPLGRLIEGLFEVADGIRCMRDPTRGGIAAALNEIAASSGVTIELEEEKMPIEEAARGACEMLGLDPLVVANEGKVVVICAPESTPQVLERMRSQPNGSSAEVIGTVHPSDPAPVIMKTMAGGHRVVEMPLGEELPRIC